MPYLMKTKQTTKWKIVDTWTFGDSEQIRERCLTVWIQSGSMFYKKSKTMYESNQELMFLLLMRMLRLLRKRSITCKIMPIKMRKLLYFNYIDCKVLKLKIQPKVFKLCCSLQNCILLIAYLHQAFTQNLQIGIMNFQYSCIHLNGILILKILRKLLLFWSKIELIQR